MTTPGKPLTRQRSPWVEVDTQLILGVEAKVYQRRVNDGVLMAIVGHEPAGWHLSISFRDHRQRLTRYPHWDEISHARYELMPADLPIAMILPPEDEFVAVHDTTFHLHEIMP